MRALLQFLDPDGTRASFSDGRLDIILNDTNEELEPYMLEFIRSIFTDYKFSISFSTEGNSAMAVTNADGNRISLPPEAEFVPSGRKVSLSMDTVGLLGFTDGLGVSFNW